MAAALARFLGIGGNKPPAPNSADTVVRMHHVDDTQSFRDICMHVTFRFDQPLDVDMMEAALGRLLGRPGWKKLGARVRLNKSGHLEYHIPQSYTPTRPAFQLTRATHAVPIGLHPIAARLPRGGSDSLSVSPHAGLFRSFLVPASTPTDLTHWLFEDRPQLALHFNSFKDATLITLTFMHTMLDGLGIGALLEAWSAELEGKPVKEFVGYDVDPLISMSEPVPATDPRKAHAEEYVLKDREIRGLGMLRVAANLVLEPLMHPAEEDRVIVIPPTVFAKMKARALSDLASADKASIVPDAADPSKPFLSDGDVLAAWYNSLVFRSEPWSRSAKPSKSVLLMNVFNTRQLIGTTEPVLIPPTSAYTSNATVFMNSLFTLQEITALPLGQVANRVRRDLVAQSTRAQVEAQQRLIWKTTKEAGHSPLFGESDVAFVVFTNWTKAKMFEMDFGAAVVGSSEGEKKRAVPSYVHPDATIKGVVGSRNAAVCMGKDSQGNWFLHGTLRKKTWENVIKAIANETF
ncbi:hypothetical protein M427DRAFT_146855 [Gonapodya prolifera JEL478]|uniref:LysR family regulatory protein n=1 Tax=Gonapodya prolifera (strain JEL478) TaxID=1344416 RepID=A0A139A852_GONPJ|nr:hypothetical protein M427DRAFT_146855 [Gonapodya prolifera JEL478]|eukprot:KXS12960.1 hypothetical protein M427DRAFT_146855 [Gonapodya prolifera JEL478]